MIKKLITKIRHRIKYYKKLIKQYSNEDTVFIYQMGKVGSTSLESSIKNAVHVHAFFLKNHTCPVRLKGLSKFGVKHFFYRAEQELLSFLLRRAFKQRSHTKIITLVREPQARNISMFFHDLDAYLYAAHTNCLNTRKSPLPTRSQSADILMDIFSHEFNHNYPLNWFDNEFLPMTGINIYSQLFDKEAGYSVIEKGKTTVLCIRTDKLANCTEQLELFIGDNVELKYENKAQGKWYQPVYQEFKCSYKSPSDLLIKQKNSQFYKHFFD
ncbi:putative capsular polysaccharide synthesis family protein [Colwelliaceae bacterium 6441]